MGRVASRLPGTVLLLACAAAVTSCQPVIPPGTPIEVPRLLAPVMLTDARATPIEGARSAEVEAARNEAVSLAVRLGPLGDKVQRKKYTLRIQPLQAGDKAIEPTQVSVYQVLPMPVDTNGADYVRHTGQPARTQKLPRALLPMKAEKGRVSLVNLRDEGQPAKPGDRDAPVREPALLWLDVRVPAEAPAGVYQGAVELLVDDWGEKVVASLPVKVTVDDFVLPDDRHLLMVAPVDWEALYRHWPAEFEAITPRLLNREEQKHAGAIRVVDELVREGQNHRVQVVFPRLQPTVKWPAGRPPQFDWLDHDTVVAPWLTGEAFTDRVPLGFWPLPKVDQLDRYDPAARAEYWQAVAQHFDQRDWLGQTMVVLDRPTARSAEGRLREASEEAAEVVRSHPRVRVAAPVQGEALPTADAGNPRLLDARDAGRVSAYAPGVVHAPPARPWPKAFEPLRRYLSAGMGPRAPYVGPGETERDVRHWAWLAFLQQAELVAWPPPLPMKPSPDEPAGADEQVWFYPGKWFGVDGPVPTLQLKWARRAAQDYEYLWLARQRGEVVSPEVVARLLSRPVELWPGQSPDPVYGLLSGTTEQKAWDEARRLVAKAIQLSQPGQTPDPQRQEELRLETVRWTVPQGRPTGLVRDVRWAWSSAPAVVGADGGRNWLDLQIGLDLYNAAEDPSERNAVEWTTLPPGWQVSPRPVEVPALPTNKVTRLTLDAKFNLDAAGATPVPRATEVTFASGYTGTRTPVRFVLPVAASPRREGELRLDGALGEWSPADAIHDGPLVRMLSRPGVQRQELTPSSTPAAVYTGWTEDNLYVAFKVEGVGSDLRASRNFVEYQARRAWGEDLCQLLVQAVYTDGSLGPVVHVVCKPNGQWVERKPPGDVTPAGEPWTPAGSDVRYAGTVDAGTWRGELALPWQLLSDPRRGRPGLVRFNFAQHKAATGESASWAGPVDHGRDESFTGVLLLRDSTR